MSSSITFDVIGLPVAQGSIKSLGRQSAGPAILTHSNRQELMPWRSIVGAAALQARPDDWSQQQAVHLSLTFRFPRPAGHFTKGGALRSTSPPYKITKPDADKLTRAILDSLAGILYIGDQQVVTLAVHKRYAVGSEPPGCLVTAILLA